MDFVRTLALRRGLTDAVITSVMASWTDSTLSNYESTWNSFRTYLREFPPSSFPPDLATVVVNFLQDRMRVV